MKYNAANQQRRAQDHVVSVHLEPLINRIIRKHLAGSAPHKDLVKEKGLGTMHFEVIVITDYNKDFYTLHKVEGLTKHLWRRLRQAIHKCEWTEHISSIYVGPDIMVNCLELYLKYHCPLEKLLKQATDSLQA